MPDIRNYGAIASAFNPANPQALSQTQQDGYSLIKSSSFFVASKDNVIAQPTGWKFHVSVAPQDVPKAWGIVSDYLMSEGAGQFKVAHPDTTHDFSDPRHPQAGKIITVYDFDDGKDTGKLMQGIEDRLHSAGIRRGPAPHFDRPLAGSNYASYRNDRFDPAYVQSKGGNVNGFADYHTLGAPELTALARQGMTRDVLYNPSGAPDPFSGMQVSSSKEQATRYSSNPDIDTVRGHLDATLGEDAIVKLELDATSWRISVPADYSRQNLAAAGIDTERVTREAPNGIMHTLVVPRDAQPAIATAPQHDPMTQAIQQNPDVHAAREALSRNGVAPPQQGQHPAPHSSPSVSPQSRGR
jgi:hypothetical protein